MTLLASISAPFSTGHQAAYRQAVRLMRSPARRAFQLEREPAALREAYGRNQFGQGCLLARRLVEVGVPFVEVSLHSAGARPSAGTRTSTTSRSSSGSARRSIRPGPRCWPI